MASKRRNMVQARWKLALSLSVFTLCLCLLGGTRFPVWGDSQQTWDAAFACLTVGLPRMPQAGRPDAILGPDGYFYSKYPLLPILQAVPALWFHAALPHSHTEGWRNLLVMLPAYVSAAVGVAALGALLQDWRIGSIRIAAWTLLCVFSTPWFVYIRSYYAEGVQTSLLIVLLYLWLRVRGGAKSGAEIFGLGLVGGLLLNCKPNFILVVATVAFDLLVQASRERNLVARLPFLGGLLPGVVLLLGYNVLRFGQISGFGYAQWKDSELGFNVPLPVGVWGLLFSSGKSIFLYAPLLILSGYLLPRFWHQRPDVGRCIAAITVPQFFLVACWWCWSGDDAWGPRLLVPLIPLWLFPTVFFQGRFERRMFTLLAVLGLVVNASGALIHPSHYLKALPPHVSYFGGPERIGQLLTDRLILVHYVPEFSPIVGHAWLLAGHFGLPISRYYPWCYQRHPDWVPKSDTFAPLDWWCLGSATDAVVLLVLAALTAFVGKWVWLSAKSECSTESPNTAPELSGPSGSEDRSERATED